ncbi:MAG: homoserine dehydrogenase [Candidatus Methanomethylophilaceae archaeon]|jgi:homoserine dehydrogenase|nr:homoserine dehydrogenase [Candidatus Methanomethylophilaceae archaeon]NCA73763.1 homoserine dehydrogenase [Gammaproteobacteria bacterium]MDD3351548.1 homoserine dehydrogenase [Candidatus Methanomethylophilaceae archaeon]MDD3986442.1 homoserine dehydrogenase [Candidatus Methanomethylophilaceae archaeon]MDD4708719.1 homoserine dehydrogenase [Candidatus Methanomethylophilaceae archaeon]
MRIFIAGFGTVGQGLAEVLDSREMFFKKRYGENVKIVGVMDSKTYVTDPEGLAPMDLVSRKAETKRVGSRTYTDALEVLDSVDYDILVEVSPTNYETGGQGLKNIVHALECGKDVITTNKGPLAIKFGDLIALARRNRCKLKFEGSVGGAMPIINLCHDNLVGEKIQSIRGILNGTCNYILSKMDSGQPFEQALKEAQQLGYAEADPTGDVGGYDSACKVVILANSVFGRNVTFSDVSITGITGITEEAIALAKSRNMVVRLIGEVTDTKLEVAPRLVPRGHPLAVTGTLNAAQILSDLAGPITITGRGAGRLETASAILSDLISVLDDRGE